MNKLGKQVGKRECDFCSNDSRAYVKVKNNEPIFYCHKHFKKASKKAKKQKEDQKHWEEFKEWAEKTEGVQVLEDKKGV